MFVVSFILVILFSSILAKANDDITSNSVQGEASYVLKEATLKSESKNLLRSPLLTNQNHSSSTIRILQRNNTEQQQDNVAAAYLKCYSLLDDATLDTGGIMTATEYVTFLLTMTDGMVNYNSFVDLPALYVMIFYTAACSNGADCTRDAIAQIDIGDTADPNEIIQFMCQQTLKSVTTTAETTFEYTIRYSTSIIEEEDLATCLSTATVNVLLSQLANCPVLADVQFDTDSRRHLLQQRRQIKKDEHQQHRQLQALGSARTDENTMCDYDIAASVERITELPCSPQIPGDSEVIENERCGLVRSTARVTAPQLYEPFSTLLRSQMVTILRRVIDTGTFTTYFPPGTCPLS